MPFNRSVEIAYGMSSAPLANGFVVMLAMFAIAVAGGAVCHWLDKKF